MDEIRVMRKLLTCLTVLLVLGTFGSPCSVALFAQSTGPSDEAPASPPLSNLQQQIQRDYERFEKSLYDVAEQSRGKDPERAELLYRARSKSQEERILSDMELVAELLSPQNDGSPARYGPAADRQLELLTRMETVLKLLQSLDERSRIDEEIKRLEELLKDTSRLIARQKDVRADSQRSDNTDKLKTDQERVADEAKNLSDKIEKQDKQREAEKKDRSDKQNDNKETDPKDSDSKTPESKDGDSKEGESKEGMPEEGKPSDPEMKNEKPAEDPQAGKPSDEKGDPKEGESKESDGQKSDKSPQQGEPQQGEPKDGKPQQGQPQQGQPQPGQPGEQTEQQQKPQDEQTPGREELEQARQQMQEAIEKLEQENKEKAVGDQDEAVAKLEQLKAELEEILRQLREEEKETYLTLLEARFQIMLKRQERINKDTTRLFNIPEADKLQQNYNSQTDGTRKEQSDNVLDAEKTLNLLKEEGSSVAFPEAIEQMMENMLVAETRLSKYDTGKTTQLVEQLILETLAEMIAALQKELEKMEKKKQEQGQPQQGQPQEPGLVDQIAELKMIRSLQNQINRLTTQLSEDLGDKTPNAADQLKLIDDLANRQERIKDATYDLSIGRNK